MLRTMFRRPTTDACWALVTVVISLHALWLGSPLLSHSVPSGDTSTTHSFSNGVNTTEPRRIEHLAQSDDSRPAPIDLRPAPIDLRPAPIVPFPEISGNESSGSNGTLHVVKLSEVFTIGESLTVGGGVAIVIATVNLVYKGLSAEIEDLKKKMKMRLELMELKTGLRKALKNAERYFGRSKPIKAIEERFELPSWILLVKGLPRLLEPIVLFFR